LKQTLKHTTDNTMNLDTTIEQRKRELKTITEDINKERDVNDQNRNEIKRAQLELLARNLEKSAVAFSGIRM
jgi:hypothetical protein